MASIEDLRDQLFRAAERILGRRLTDIERSQLVDVFNRYTKQGHGTVINICMKTLEEVLNVDLTLRILLEKAASVDQVQAAVNSLRMVSAKSAKEKKSKKK